MGKQSGPGYFSKLSYFEINYRLSYINALITTCSSCLGVIFKAELQQTEMILLSSLVFLIVITFLLYVVNKFDGESSKRCFLHAKLKSECIECTENYGLCIEEYKATRVCKTHRKAEPCVECGRIVENIKLVAVGQEMVGKTCILTTYAENHFPTEWVPTVFDNFIQTLS